MGLDYPFTVMIRSSKQKGNQETSSLNDTLEQLDLNIYRTFHLKKKNTHTEYTFFSSPHGTFSRVEYMLRHKTSLNKFKVKNC